MKDEKSYTNVLLVSDNQLDSQGIEQQFMDKGGMDCRLYRCTTISAALEQLGKKGLMVDIVIIDLRLQDIVQPSDHYQTIKDSAESIPVIVLTGDSEEEQAQAVSVMAEGAGGHIYKGKFNELVNLIGSLVFAKTREFPQ